ncbi:MAG: hypothetical protein AVDCRST_MAG52-3126 [uncultured Blastococcus sp.]|uniref:Uncharacterized protein n=1 Tax=uncultured Blastococcus sp. TaxID=217144 RepID=A0A6J4J6X0_9ACTN|nr:MAG: hypothetical protein AVDCRST_MAG52-3126 [uncultured Blastococcus sp.]
MRSATPKLSAAVLRAAVRIHPEQFHTEAE